MAIDTMAKFIDKMEYEGSLYDMVLYLGRLPENFEDKDFRDTFNSFSHLSEDLDAMVEDYYENHPELYEE